MHASPPASRQPRRDGLPRLRTVLAPNPSPLTFTGTNTYILGSGTVAVIDPGPADDRHLAALLAALDPGESISHIFVTHPHRDHSALAPRLAAATGAPVLAYGSATDGRSRVMQRLADAGLAGSGGDGLDRQFRPDTRLADRATVTGGNWEITALHTPGHLGAHLCLACDDLLFSGDHVMGWSTSVISPPDGDMTDYLASLDRLASIGWSRMLPGHGDPVDDPAGRLRDLISHRRQREAQILAALRDSAASPGQLVDLIYPGLDPSLRSAAQSNVLAHLLDLASKSLVRPEDGGSPDTTFHRM